MRFGPQGDMSQTKCWGFDLDKMGEMGRRVCSDEAYQNYLLHPEDGDPREGPFYTIVHRLEEIEKKRSRCEA